MKDFEIYGKKIIPVEHSDTKLYYDIDDKTMWIIVCINGTDVLFKQVDD